LGKILAAPLRKDPLLPGTWKNLFYPPERGEFTYFARAKSCPFTSGSTYMRAAWAADAAMLAYGRFGKDPMPLADFEGFLTAAGFRNVLRIGDCSEHGTQGYFASNDQFSILSFRGTEADDPLDSLADLDILLVDEHDFRPAPEEAHLGLRHLSLIEELITPRCLVHQGFQRALNQIWNNVHGIVSTYRRSHPGGELCFTGHSLGAALATLAFSRFRDPNISLYSFGCPRVGNSAFSERVPAIGDRVLRFVNLNDPVAHVPIADGAYQHAPQRSIRIDENGNLTDDDGSFHGDVRALKRAIAGVPRAGVILFPNSDAPEGVVDHSPARYCVRLWNCV
jgi:triacylglycerol lipase